MKISMQPRIRSSVLASKLRTSRVKKIAECYLRDSSRPEDNQILIYSMHLGTISVKRTKHLLYDVYWLFEVTLINQKPFWFSNRRSKYSFSVFRSRSDYSFPVLRYRSNYVLILRYFYSYKNF